MRKSYNIKILIVSFFVLVAIPCIVAYWISKAPQRALKKQVISMTGTKVNSTFKHAEAYFNGIDSFYNSTMRKKLIVYVDSSSCTGCFIHHLSDYFEVNDTLTAGNAELIIVMQPHPSKIKEVRDVLCSDSMPFWCIIDKECELKRNNSKLKDTHILHSFLLDENDKIILIGNPIRNPRIKELLYKSLK